MFNFGFNPALRAAINMVKGAVGLSRETNQSEKVGERVKGKNHKMRKRPQRTSVEMLKRRAVNPKIEGNKMRFARGKLIGGQPRLFRP